MRMSDANEGEKERGWKRGGVASENYARISS